MIKMKTRTLFFVALLIISPALSYGQIGNLLKNRASKVLNTVSKSASKEASKEIDSAAQKQADKMIISDTGKQASKAEGQGGVNLGKLFGGKVDLKYNEEYKFNSRMVMQLEIYDKKEVTKMLYDIYFSSTVPNMVMEIKNLNTAEGESVPFTTRMVMDGENKCFLMLTDMNATKMGMISAVPDENTTQSQNGEKPAETVKPPSVTKTGSTRVIAGYKCDEYLVKDETSKGYTKMWFTKEAVINVDKRAWAKAGMPSAYGYQAFEGGIIMGYEYYDEAGKLSTKSEVIEVYKNYDHSVSVKGYSLRQMNFSQMQNQKK